MRVKGLPLRFLLIRNVVAILCAVLLAPGDTMLYASQQAEGAVQQQDAPKVPSDQLDSLVAPIALYPDPLLSQVLVASTYPLEIIQLQQWLGKNKNLKDKALTDAVQKQDWDPSIQAMAVLPDVVKQLADNVKWTTDLGNAFLAQQADVMEAVQRMRKKAQDKGNLKSSEQQKVETKVVENKQVIVVQPASPEVVYVPSYNPTIVYGPPVYAYPPIVYPPPPPTGAYVAGMALSFGVGMMVGAAWGHGGWGWGCSWGHNDVTINNNNNFNRNANINRQNVQGGNRVNARGGNNTWQHNPQHRGGAPYSNRATASKYGGTARGDSMSTRQATTRQNQGAMRNTSAGARSGTMDRGAGGSRDSSAFGGGGSSGASARASSQRGSSSMASSRGSGGFSRGGGGRRR